LRQALQLASRSRIIALALLAALATPAFGTPINAFVFPQPSSASNTVTGNDAFFFTPATDIVVSALGMYDHNQDGLTQVHTIGLYQVSGSLLLQSVTVGPSDGFIYGVFRFQSISDTRLFAGTQYAVSGFTVAAAGSHAWKPPGLVIAPQIGYNGYSFNYTGSPSLPTGPLDRTTSFFGPSFLFSNAPEPATMILIGTGLILLGLRRRQV
jgi:hypothetical protein